MIPLFSTEFVVDDMMTGSKFAYHIGPNRILVSPAMMFLIDAAKTEEELRDILSKIPVKHGPNLDNFSFTKRA